MIILIIIFTISIVPKEFQNDTFFTIAVGNEILENGVQSEEKLVWHEGLEFTNSRWLFDTLITLIYNNFGFDGIYCFVIVLAVIQMLLYYFVLNKMIKNEFLSFLFTLCTAHFIAYEFAARAQIISFLLFLIEFYAVEQLVKTNKNLYFGILIFIPLILVNIHASVFPMYFVFYLPYIAEFILSRIQFKNENETKIITENININKMVILIIIGIILGFCTPPGIEPYTDMFKAMGGMSTEFIAELQPLNILDSTYFSILIIITIAIIGFTKTKVKLTDCLYILGFGLMSLSTYRCVFFFYLISSICIFRIVNTFLELYEVKLDIHNKYLKEGIIVFLYLFIIIASAKNISLSIATEYVNRLDYPVDVSNYILENYNVDEIKIFNHFNFGSYLEFRGIKAFIDSRSGIFTPEFNSGCTILEDWYMVENGQANYKEIFEKYDITHVLLYKDCVIFNYIVYDNEWKIVYDSGAFSLFEKVNN